MTRLPAGGETPAERIAVLEEFMALEEQIAPAADPAARMEALLLLDAMSGGLPRHPNAAGPLNV
jgi:hypothetical protein